MLRFQRDGDDTALARLFERNRGVLLRFLTRLSRNRTVAEDVAQQTWLKVIDVAHQGAFAATSGVAFRTWLSTLARNHFIDEYRRSSSLRAAYRCLSISKRSWRRRIRSRPSGGTAGRSTTSARLHEALLRLPFEQRRGGAMGRWCRIAAIAALTEAPRDTVLSRKKYALAKLRLLLHEKQVTAG